MVTPGAAFTLLVHRYCGLRVFYAQVVRTTIERMKKVAGKLDLAEARTEPENGDFGIIEFEGTSNQAPYVVVDANAFDHQRNEVSSLGPEPA